MSSPEEQVRLTVPATVEYVRLVRLTASGIATKLGFDVEEIENLRVAIDELASMVVEFAAPGDFDVEFRAAGGELRVTGKAPLDTTAHVVVDDLTGQILKAVTDEYDLYASDGFVQFDCARGLPTGGT